MRQVEIQSINLSRIYSLFLFLYLAWDVDLHLTPEIELDTGRLLHQADERVPRSWEL